MGRHRTGRMLGKGLTGSRGARPALAAALGLLATSMLFCCAAAPAAPCRAAPATAHGVGALATRPNIVLVMADDLGYGEVGAYGAHSPHGRIATPSLDEYFAAGGMRFTDAYAGYTVCGPSRTALLTGRHSGNFARYGYDGEHLAAGQAVTLGEVLSGAGYATALFGKSAPLSTPTASGFDAFVGQVSQLDCHNMYPRVIDAGETLGGCNLTLNWKAKSRDLCMASPERYNYTTDVFVGAALKWLDNIATAPAAEGSAEQRPFFLYLSLTVPHAGGWTDNAAEEGAPVPNDLQYVNESSWPDVERDHAAAITYMDTCVGALVRKLRALGVEKDTLVLFASDNGAHLEGGHDVRFFNSTGGLRGHKRSMFEGGVRSPTMVRWPGRVRAGSVSRVPWAFWDVLPTLAEVAGASSAVPDDVDGRSFLRTLLGPGDDGVEGELRGGAGVVGRARAMRELDAQDLPLDSAEFLYFTGANAWANEWFDDGTEQVWGEEGEAFPAAPAALGPLPAEAPPRVRLTSYSVRAGRWKAVGSRCKHVPSMKDPIKLFDLQADPFEKRVRGRSAAIPRARRALVCDRA